MSQIYEWIYGSISNTSLFSRNTRLQFELFTSDGDLIEIFSSQIDVIIGAKLQEITGMKLQTPA